ncbi:MAG: ADP-glyceromanno-heptose 6-epimerase [Gammaproteobacteria bacterium]
MIAVTGGAGFIGSNLLRGLNAAGHRDVLVIDDMSDGWKFQNLRDCHIADYLDKEEFRGRIRQRGPRLPDLSMVFHHGACTDTAARDGRLVLECNYSYSKELLDYCLDCGVPFIYASSAAVYGVAGTFVEREEFELPVNVYGYSKKLFDDYVRDRLSHARSQIAGLRYFNVYGPRERHKGRMASVAFHLNEQLKRGEKLKLFKGSGGYGDGEQRRDFLHVQDAVDVNLWFMSHPEISGIFNVGTGSSRSFRELAELIIDCHGKGRIEYIDFPRDLISSYQHFTEADVRSLRSAGYRSEFTGLEQGIRQYLQWLNEGHTGGLV